MVSDAYGGETGAGVSVAERIGRGRHKLQKDDSERL